MRYLVEIEASSCNDCIFCQRIQDTNATLHACGHKHAPKGYSALIEMEHTGRRLRTPGWCPLAKQIPISSEPAVPCMDCNTGKMVYTGEIITTSRGIPVLRCVACGARAELKFDFNEAKKPDRAYFPVLTVRQNRLLPPDVVEVRDQDGKLVGTIKLG